MSIYSSKAQQILDKQIMRLSERSDILRFLDPLNKYEELQTFVDRKGDYNPQFIYETKHISLLDQIINYITKLQDKSHSLKIDTYNKRSIQLKQGMIDKCNELLTKFSLLRSYHHQEFESIYKYNTQLFDQSLSSHTEILWDSYNTLEKQFYINPADLLSPLGYTLWDQLNAKQVKQIVAHHLNAIWLSNYRIIFGEYGSTSMQVHIGPKPNIFINKRASYDSFQVVVSILHEIYGHLLRYKQGKESGIHLYQWWTAYYLSTEEGIAVFQAARVEWFEIVWKRGEESYRTNSLAMSKNRSQMSSYLQDCWYNNYSSIFWNILRIKRGVVDSSVNHPGSVMMKDRVYHLWYQKVCRYLLDTLGKKWWGGKLQQYMFDTQLFQGRVWLDWVDQKQ